MSVGATGSSPTPNPIHNEYDEHNNNVGEMNGDGNVIGVVDDDAVGAVVVIDRHYGDAHSITMSNIHHSYTNNISQWMNEVSKCGLSRSQIECLYTSLSGVYIKNYNELFDTINNILDMDREYRLKLKHSRENRDWNRNMNNLRSVNDDNDISHPILHLVCNKDTIIEGLMNCNSYTNLHTLLKHTFNECNVLFSYKWSVLVSTLPRMLPILKPKLLVGYRVNMRLFWKRQVLLNICR